MWEWECVGLEWNSQRIDKTLFLKKMITVHINIEVPHRDVFLSFKNIIDWINTTKNNVFVKVILKLNTLISW